MIRINVIQGGETSEQAFGGSSVTIGRSSECDLVIKAEGYLSRRHCRIDVVGSHCEVVDLSSKNGVQINGIFFRQGILEVGDEVRLGEVMIELLEFGPEPAEPERVRPCLICGYIMAMTTENCPACAGEVVVRRRETIRRDHIPGYDLRRKLGSGGMGIVFEAHRHADDTTTAIKILKPHLARNPAYLVRFVEETRLLTLLKHPHIVQIYGRGADRGLTYIDMELVRGDSARHLIRRRSRVPERQALRIIWETVLALDFAAKRRIIHGDVKPSNILIDHSGSAKLCDFGLARFMRFGMGGSPLFSPEASGRKGTAAYAAPERFLSGAKPTMAGDIYSMGVSLYHMLTGELPFGTNKDARSLEGRSEVPDPTLLVEDLRSATATFVTRMMAHQADDRYQTWRAVQDDLAVLLD
ncbi:MAG: protein kinase [Planctomycetes bacterium]|nr:protein kinase [Planctomycetota bacterium]